MKISATAMLSVVAFCASVPSGPCRGAETPSEGDVELPQGSGLVISFNVNDKAGLVVLGVATNNRSPLVSVELSTRQSKRIPFDAEIAVFATAISPDGRIIAAARNSGTVNYIDLLDATSGDVTKTLNVGLDAGMIRVLRYSNSGKFLAIGFEQALGRRAGLKVWNLEAVKFKVKCSGHEMEPVSTRMGVMDCDFLSEDALVTSGTDNKVRLWDLDTGKQSREFEGHEGTVESVRSFDNGRKIVSGGSRDGTILMWNSLTGQELWRLKVQEEDSPISVSATTLKKQHFVAAGGAKRISIVDAQDGRLLKTIDTGGPARVEFSQSGERL